jgi:hypothetical protein
MPLGIWGEWRNSSAFLDVITNCRWVDRVTPCPLLLCKIRRSHFYIHVLHLSFTLLQLINKLHRYSRNINSTFSENCVLLFWYLASRLHEDRNSSNYYVTEFRPFQYSCTTGPSCSSIILRPSTWHRVIRNQFWFLYIKLYMGEICLSRFDSNVCDILLVCKLFVEWTGMFEMILFPNNGLNSARVNSRFNHSRIYYLPSWFCPPWISELSNSSLLSIHQIVFLCMKQLHHEPSKEAEIKRPINTPPLTESESSAHQWLLFN